VRRRRPSQADATRAHQTGALQPPEVEREARGRHPQRLGDAALGESQVAPAYQHAEHAQPMRVGEGVQSGDGVELFHRSTIVEYSCPSDGRAGAHRVGARGSRITISVALCETCSGDRKDMPSSTTSGKRPRVTSAGTRARTMPPIATESSTIA